MRYLFLLGLLAATAHLQAQRGIQLVEEPGIRRMLDQRRALNADPNRTIKLWSVQLMLNRDKYIITEKREQFAGKYPEYKAEWSYEQPYYKLNAGAFYTKLEAASLLQKISRTFPDAYIFKNSQARPSDM